MSTKNFYISNGLRVSGDTLLNGSTYNDTPSTKLHVKSANSVGANLNNVQGIIVENSGSSSSNYILKLASGAGNLVSITNSGNVGIGTTSPSHKLDVTGTGRFTDYLISDGFVGNGGALRIANPGGASFASGTPALTGYLKITLPQSWTSTMMRMTIKCYEYSTGRSFEINCGGYNYSPTTTWINTFAYIISDPSFTGGRNFNVRFGHDGTKCAIYIGESTSEWSYFQFGVTDFLAGYNNYEADKWNNDWSCSVTPTSGTITATQTNNQVGKWVDNNIVWHAGNDGSGSGLDADLLDGSQRDSSATGFVGNTIPVRNANGYLYSNYFNMTANTTTASATKIAVETSSDGFIRWQAPSQFITNHSILTTADEGSGNGLDADTVDSLEASQFLRSDANDTATGVISFTSSSAYPVTIDGSNDAKIVLAGSSSPYIRFRENTTDRGYIQWNPSLNGLSIVNQEGPYLFLISGSATVTGLSLRTSDGVQRGLLYGNSSNDIGILDAGGAWAIRHTNDIGTRFYDTAIERASIGSDTVTSTYGTIEVKDGSGKGAYDGYSIQDGSTYGQSYMSNGTYTGLFDGHSNHFRLYYDNTTIYTRSNVISFKDSSSVDGIIFRLDDNAADQGSPWIRTDGDHLVLNAVDGEHIYLNWDSSGGGSGHAYVRESVYAKRFVDRDSTSYYLDPASTSYLSSVNVDSDLVLAGTSSRFYLDSGSANLHDSRFELWPSAGAQLLQNIEFYSDLTGYSTYDNAGSGAVTRALVADSSAPNSSGNIMRVTYTTGVGTPTPGFGGFYVGITEGTVYQKGDVIIWRVMAKIPSGRSIQWASNAYGTESTAYWLTDRQGTGDWKEYIYFQKIGETGSFSSTGFFYILDGTDSTFSWDVARVQANTPSRDEGIFRNNDRLFWKTTDSRFVFASGGSGGTPGYLPYYNSADTFSNSNIYYDGTNVGIGTTDPSGYKLNVNGSLRTASDVTIAGNIAGVQSITASGTITLTGIASGTDNTVLIHNASNQVNKREIDSRVWGSSLVDGSGTANYVPKWSDSNTLTNSLIFDNGTNVGIGTTVIVNPQSWGRLLQVFSGLTTGAGISLHDSNNEYNIATYAGSLFISDGVDERITINSSGDVGIGTTSPAYKLDVNTSGARIGSSDQQGVTLRLTATNTAGAPSYTTRILMEGYEGRGIGTFYTDTSYSGEQWFNGLNYAGNFNYWSVGYDSLSGQPEYLANSLLTVLDTGNVGIGVSPIDKFQVLISTYNEIGFRTAEPSVISDVVTLGPAIRFSRPSDGSDNIAGIFTYQGSSGTNLALASRSDIVFTAGGSSTYGQSPERVRLNSSGHWIPYVDSTQDLGTTLKRWRTLYVDDIVLTNGVTHGGDTDTYLDFYQADGFRVVTGGTERIRINNSEIAVNEGSNDYDFRVESNNDTHCLFVDGSADNVGIGTTSPAYKLDVAGAIRTTTNFVLGQYLFHDGDADTYLDFYTADSFRVVTGGTERIRINNSEIAVNDGSHDYDFRVESNNETNMIFVNGGADSIGIATNAFTSNRLSVESHNPTITTNSTTYWKSVFASIIGAYNIASGVTDSGYRIALDASSYVNDSDFQGTLAAQYSIWARHGAFTSGAGSTITSSVGVLIDSLTNANTTITNLYGLYQQSTLAKNYFGGNVGIGTTSPAYKLDVTGDIRATTNMYLGQYLYHDGDTDTYLEFVSDNNFRIVANGAERFRVNNIETVVNESSNDYDFRVESNNDTHCLFVEGSTDYVGIGTSQPNEKLTVVGNISASGTVYGDASEFGAIMEAGLHTFNISELPEGSVLIWRDGKLIPCDTELDKNVTGISTPKGDSPIVLGAEPVLVTGPIKEGDFIITSNKLGHGMRVDIDKYNYTEVLGTIIAQALESGDGVSYTIKAMIRKL